MLRFTQLSDRMPPTITPMNELAAMVMVDIGPASDIGMSRLVAKSVGSQFFVAQPGRLGTAK